MAKRADSRRLSRYVDGLRLLADQVSEQVSMLVSHRGEKGRAAEHIVRGLIRALLPKKFSIGSGFIVTSEDQKSRQLDIVLFDESVNAPINLVGNIGVFPVECVYGAIEVKSYLNKAAIEQSAESISEIRRFKTQKFYRPTEDLRSTKTEIAIRLAPRSYIFAFNTSYASIEALQSALEKAVARYGGFFHGVIVMKKNWFVCQLATKKGQPLKFKSRKQDALSNFTLKLSKDTINYPMYAANMARYLGSIEESEAT